MKKDTKNNMKPQILNLTGTEKDKIYKICKHNKFENAELKMIYPSTNVEKLEYFNKCCRFFINLLNVDLFESTQEDSSETLKKIKQKIELFVSNIEEIYKKSLENMNSYQSCETSLKKDQLINKINIFVLENMEIIDFTIDKTHELGKQIKQYDVDTVQGYS